MSTFFEDLRLVRPSEVFLPPRLTSMMYDKFQAELRIQQELMHTPEDKEAAREVINLPSAWVK
jgi:long-subunit acyl-CoA synthetase (AMP-forming)